MAKRKYPSELNTRHVRVSLGDYALLREISLRANVTMAEALHLAIERQEQVVRVSPSQTRLPVFQVTGQPTFRVLPQPTIAVNGNKSIALRIKAKGVIVNE